MNKLQVEVEALCGKDSHQVVLRWNGNYVRKASSHREIFDEIPRATQPGSVDVFELPLGTKCVALFEDKHATGPDKLCALYLFPDPTKSDDEKEVLIWRTDMPTLYQMRELGWLPFSYANGLLRVRAESGKIYIASNGPATSNIQAKTYRVEDVAMLLRFICGVLDEKTLNNFVRKESPVRATSPVREASEDDEIKKLKKEIKERDRLISRAYKAFSISIRSLFTKENWRYRRSVLRSLRRHTKENPVPPEDNLLQFDEIKNHRQSKGSVIGEKIKSK